MHDRDVCIGHINLAAGYRGGERQTQLLIEGLARNGWRQKLVARRGEPLAKRCRGITGLEIVETSASVMAAGRALSGAGLAHVHQGRSLKAAFLNHLFRGTPYIVTRRVQKGPRDTWLNRLMYRQASCVAVLSSAIGESVRRLGADIEPIVIPSAASRLDFDQARADEIRSQTGAGFLVGHIGALDDSHKGQLQIIQIARDLVIHNREIHFLLIGSGRDESILKREAQGLDNVHFIGQTDNVGDYLAAFDIFIYPSRHEGLGSILLDAMGFGLPVVATDVGGIPDIIENKTNGVLCKVDDIGALSAAVMTLFTDNKLREQMAVANRSKADQYRPEVMTRRYSELYERLEQSQS
jgi:glycosyltransferase involved in cell wall biosynthesis